MVQGLNKIRFSSPPPVISMPRSSPKSRFVRLGVRIRVESEKIVYSCAWLILGHCWPCHCTHLHRRHGRATVAAVPPFLAVTPHSRSFHHVVASRKGQPVTAVSPCPVNATLALAGDSPFSPVASFPLQNSEPPLLDAIN
jgi:hypothetical protein